MNGTNAAKTARARRRKRNKIRELEAIVKAGDRLADEIAYRMMKIDRMMKARRGS